MGHVCYVYVCNTILELDWMVMLRLTFPMANMPLSIRREIRMKMKQTKEMAHVGLLITPKL